jgi:hypothetical protein
MIGEVFRIEEIERYGHPWIRKSWPNDKEGTCHSHSIALEAQEMEIVEESVAYARTSAPEPRTGFRRSSHAHSHMDGRNSPTPSRQPVH